MSKAHLRELYLLREYDVGQRKDLQLRLRQYLERERDRLGKMLSGRAVHEIMSRFFRDKFHLFIDGEDKGMRYMECVSYKTIYNFYTGRTPFENVKIDLLWCIDTFLQALSYDNVDSERDFRFESQLGSLTAKHLMEPRSHRKLGPTLQNRWSIYSARSPDLALPSPSPTNYVFLAMNRGLNNRYLRVRLITTPKYRISMALKSEVGKSDTVFHEYVGIGVQTIDGLNIHLRDHYYGTAYCFIKGMQINLTPPPENITMKISSQHELRSDIENEDFQLDLNNDIEICEYIQKMIWWI